MSLRVVIGFDERQPLSANVLAHSISRRSTKPVTIMQPRLSTLPIKRQGLTEFTYSRYLTPWLFDYDGWALFMDSDMLVMGDIAELFALADDQYSVMVVKNQMRFEWPSLMLFNCAKCKTLTPKYVDTYASPQDFMWAGGSSAVGDIPSEWNHLANYDLKQEAKLAHFTQGMPIWFETRDSDYAEDWMSEMKDMQRICEWKDLMVTSVHAKPVLEKMLRGYAEAQVAQSKAMQPKAA